MTARPAGAEGFLASSSQPSVVALSARPGQLEGPHLTRRHAGRETPHVSCFSNAFIAAGGPGVRRESRHPSQAPGRSQRSAAITPACSLPASGDACGDGRRISGAPADGAAKARPVDIFDSKERAHLLPSCAGQERGRQQKGRACHAFMQCFFHSHLQHLIKTTPAAAGCCSTAALMMGGQGLRGDGPSVQIAAVQGRTGFGRRALQRLQAAACASHALSPWFATTSSHHQRDHGAGPYPISLRCVLL